MNFKPTTWHPIAVGLSAINLIGLGAAGGVGEVAHAAVHAVLALAFGAWARYLRLGPRSERELRLQQPDEAMEAELYNLRQELLETREHLDFAERLLAQGMEPRAVDRERADREDRE